VQRRCTSSSFPSFACSSQPQRLLQGPCIPSSRI
jgi:hypothetical protein